MEATSSGLLANFINTIVININFQVLLNIFLYSVAATSGILFTSKIITLLFEDLLQFIRFKKELKYKNKIEEIRELNKKMHDRLVELEEVIRLKKLPGKLLRKRLLYNMSRIAKYDKTIVDDVYSLLVSWEIALSINKKNNQNSGNLSKEKAICFTLSKKIKKKIDKLLV